MIRIQKPATVPAVLSIDGATETQSDCADYLADPKAYQKGTKKFEFKNNIYGAREVKEKLIHAQHGKCAFCESKITHQQPGDVEHFRPKAEVSLSKGKGKRLGYYWLAYDWDNLLLACAECNRRHKGSAFPLLKGSRRARDHRDDIANESPVFIHPAKEDPETLIGFREHVPYPLRGNTRARQTIEALGLLRKDLMKVREERFQILKVLKDLCRVAPPGKERKQAEALLVQAREDTGEFAAMARCFLR